MAAKASLQRPAKAGFLASNITVTFVVVFAVALILLGVFILVNFRTFFVRRAMRYRQGSWHDIPQGQLQARRTRRASEEITCVVTLTRRRKTR